MWELRGEGRFWSFMFGSRIGEGWGPDEGSWDLFCPFYPGGEKNLPQRPGAFMEPPALIPRFCRSEPWWGEEIEVLWRYGGAKDEETSPPHLGPPFLLIVGVSHSVAGFSGLRGAPALPKQQRTKGRRPCWHHDAASLQPAARAPPVLPAALAPPSQTRVLF